MLDIRLSDGIPLESVYVSDIKLGNHDISVKESALYGQVCLISPEKTEML